MVQIITGGCTCTHVREDWSRIWLASLSWELALTVPDGAMHAVWGGKVVSACPAVMPVDVSNDQDEEMS